MQAVRTAQRAGQRGSARRALGHRLYRRLLLAQVIALSGTGLATVALGLLAYELAGASAGTVLGTALAVKMLAYVVVAPLAQAVVTHLPRRVVLIAADLVRLVVAACLPWVDQTWQIYLLVFVLQASSATFTPTFQSVIPDVLDDEDDYTAALSLSRLAYDLEAILSPLLAAVLLLMIPGTALFFGTAAGFAVSASLIIATRIPTATSPDPAPFLDRVREGARLFWHTPALRPILATNLAVAAAGAFVVVQTVVIAQETLARETLGWGETAVAALLAINGTGSVMAAVMLPRLLRRLPERTVMLGAVTLLTVATALAGAVLALPPSIAVAIMIGGLWFVIGWGWSAAETPVGRLIRRHVDAPRRPAAFAAQFSLSHAGWLITYPLAGWLGARNLVAAALVLAAIAIIATIAATLLWPRGTQPRVTADA